MTSMDSFGSGSDSGSGMVCSTRGASISPVRNVDELAAMVTSWRAYGEALDLQRSDGERAASILCLGDVGYVLMVKDHAMLTRPWPFSHIVTRVAHDGAEPSVAAATRWYYPDETTDLDGSRFSEDQIQGDARAIAQAAWAWLMNDDVLDGFMLNDRRYDPVAVDSLDDGIRFINDHMKHEHWPAEACREALALAATLKADRVLVISPWQISMRVSPTEPQVLFLRHARYSEVRIHVVGLPEDV